MNTSTTSLVSTTSSSGSLKPYVCAQSSAHAHADKYKHRTKCTLKTPQIHQSFRHLTSTKSPKPTLPERERAVQRRETELEKREARIQAAEENLNKRERGLRSAFLELAQVKARAACNAAAKDQAEARKSGGMCQSWKQIWKRKDSNGKGWAKWEEGRFG